MTIFYCVECQNVEDRDSEDGWDCSRCGDPMIRFNEASEERSEIERLREAARAVVQAPLIEADNETATLPLAPLNRLRAALGEERP
jgi:hypothetical protein